MPDEICWSGGWARASPTSTKLALMARIIQHEIQAARALTLFAFQQAQAEQRRRTWRNLGRDCDALGRGCRKLDYAPGIGNECDQGERDHASFYCQAGVNLPLPVGV